MGERPNEATASLEELTKLLLEVDRRWAGEDWNLTTPEECTRVLDARSCICSRADC
jgi:hypothetical protein